MSFIAKLLVLIPLLASLGQGAPVSTDLDTNFATTFEKFFRIKDLIDNINIKHFRALQGRKADSAVPAIEDASTSADAGADAAVLMEIDLTEEAISNDQVTKLDVKSKISNDQVTKLNVESKI